MPKQIKNTPQKPLKLVKMLCEECGEVIEVPQDSVCWHCGQRLVKYAKWRVKK